MRGETTRRLSLRLSVSLVQTQAQKREIYLFPECFQIGCVPQGYQ